MSDSINNTEIEYIPAQRFADLLLDIGTYLQSSGAHCGRINNNLKRIAKTWDFDINIDPTFKGLLVKVRDNNNHLNTITSYRQSPDYSAHLAVLTDVSQLVWETYDHKLSITDVENRFEQIKSKKSYPWWLITLIVGFACAGLCALTGGDIFNAMTAMVAASVGYAFKVLIDRKKFNPMISIGMAASVTTFITGTANLFGVGTDPQAAMATAVLYLIPGVPLINCVIDLIDGYLSSAINRALYGGFILLCIATGMTLCITLLGINNFN